MIALPAIASIPSASSAAAALTVADFVSGSDPTSDPRIGAVAELVVKPNAVLLARQQLWLSQYLQSRSLLDLASAPDLADADAVDALLSNFRVARLPGSASSGLVRVVSSSNLTVAIGVGSTFTVNGVKFSAPISYTAKKEAELVVSPGDRLLQAAGDGTYYFSITLVSVGLSVTANVPASSAVIPDVVPANFVRAYTLTDFAGGLTPETNADLVLRLSQGIAAPTPSNRFTMQAWLRQDSRFQSFVRSSIVGAGQAEMLRSKHSLFPVDAGGRVDWYVRTAADTATAAATLTATLVSLAGDGTGTWQVAISRDLMPGFYSVESIRPAGSSAAGGLLVTSDARGIDLSNLAYAAPDVRTPVEVLYSRFQTAIVQFSGPAAGLSAGATAFYDLTLRGMPQIGDLQDAVSSPAQSHVGADCVVRAPVPCWVDAGIRVEKRAGTADPDFAGMAAAVTARIQAMPFTGRLYASDLLAAASPYLAGNSGLVVESFRGTIPRPGKLPLVVSDPELLVVPTSVPDMISPNTVQFFGAGVTIYSAATLPASG